MLAGLRECGARLGFLGAVSFAAHMRGTPSTDQSREALLQEFVTWAAAHITGDEKGEAQVFLDRLFRGFGQKGSLDVGGTAEMRIRKASEDGGGTSFADYVWKPVVLIEMKKRGADLSKHYWQAFDYWIRLVAGRPQLERSRMARPLSHGDVRILRAGICPRILSFEMMYHLGIILIIFAIGKCSATTLGASRWGHFILEDGEEHDGNDRRPGLLSGNRKLACGA
jgi:hypothetical protein